MQVLPHGVQKIPNKSTYAEKSTQKKNIILLTQKLIAHNPNKKNKKTDKYLNDKDAENIQGEAELSSFSVASGSWLTSS